MLIDWFTVLAQIINFLILVGLLKYFLYGRITRAMDEREHAIAARLEDAAAKHREAEGEAAKHQQQLAAFEQEREQLLDQAKAEAEARRLDLVQEAREEADRLRMVWQEDVRQEAARFLQDLRQRTATQVCEIARRALQDLATADLESHVMKVFLEDVRSLDDEQAAALIDAIREGENTLTVNSAFPLPEKMREEITHTLRECLVNDVEVRFSTTPEIICGVAVEARGQKIVWSLEHYLDVLEHNVAAMLTEKTRQEISKGEQQTTQDGGEILALHPEESATQSEERPLPNTTKESHESGS